MKKTGIYVRVIENVTEHFAVLDEQLVWHGGVNFLGKEDAWENLIRVKDSKAALELLALTFDEKEVE